MSFAVAYVEIETGYRADNHQRGVAARGKAGDTDPVRIDQCLPVRIVQQLADRGLHLDRPAVQYGGSSDAARVVEIVLGMFQRCDHKAVARQINREIVMAEVRAAMAVRD